MSIETASEILDDGVVMIEFPLWNPERESNDDGSYVHYFSGSASCTAVTNLDSDVSCAYDDSDQILTLSDGLPDGLAAGSTIAFTVSGFRNPMNGEEATGFILYTGSSDSDTIDAVSATL